MVLANEPSWLHTLGQMAATVLMVELVLVLVVVAALMVAIAVAAWWVRRRLIPVLDTYGLRTQHILRIAERGGDRVAEGVAEFRGRWTGLEAGIRTFIFGRPATRHPLLPAEATAPGVSVPAGITPVMGYAPQELPAASDAYTPIPATDETRPPGSANGHTPPARHAG